MPVEMFPLLYGGYVYVSSGDCEIEATAFLNGDDPEESESLSYEGLWCWQTIRDLMLSGF